MEWIECKLGDILNFRRGYDLPHSEMRGGNVPVAGSNGVIGYHDVATEISPVITIGRSGNVGTPYIYEKAWAHNTTLYIDDFKGNDPLYLFYLIKTLPLASFGGGSAVPTLNRNHIHPLVVKHCPDIVEQRRVAEILKTFDDKIALNNRINHNLAEQIQERFDSMVMSDNGLGCCTLADYVEINPKRVLGKKCHARCIDMSNLSTSGPFPSGWEIKDYNGGMKFQNGDTIMARITPCLENGKVAYVNFLDEDEVAFGSTEYIVLHSKDDLTPVFTYFLARNNNFVDYATKNMNGSSGRQRVAGDTIGKYVLPVINTESLREFTVFANPAMDVIRNNCFESRSLAATRDALIPLLLSGDLAIEQMNC